MISEFIRSTTGIQLSVVIFLIVYLLADGVKYQLIAIYAYLSGRCVLTNGLGILLNCGG